MLTIESLKALGADTETGLARCVNNEDFYLSMVKIVLEDNGYDELKALIDSHSIPEAFERAHALKGILGNVSLTTLYEPVAEMTEELRAGKDIDYSGYISTIMTELEKYKSLL